ncbi:T6SS immunity protein Tli4 family protein [Iodobacter sp.]|uniref:T6SS immunity protein Tli4 family protein n=1 Tax=Iodobacter sp. TaxID=1915058 RepID=UPI0025D19ADB|nr:T6SS immunity protein Tli4 family protein [Iodobacter sp.]
MNSSYLNLFIMGVIASTPIFADKGSTMKQTNLKIEALFKQTKPVCFGRFIIQVPESAVVAWGGTAVEVGIVTYLGQGAKIPAEIKEKTDEISAIKHSKEPSSLIGVFDGPNKNSKIVVGYKDRHSNTSLQIFSFIQLGKDAFVQTSKPTLFERDSNKKWVVNKDGYKKNIYILQEIASLLRLRSETEIPSEQGICIESGFVPEANGKYYERTSIGFSFPEYPDVRFSISAVKTDQPRQQDSLESSLKEGAENAGLFGLTSLFNRIKVLRKGERKIGDWDGAEQLSWMPPDEKGMPWTHEFKFKSIGVAKDMFRPYIDMELSTGVSKNSRGVNEPSLKDDEAIALWDKFTASIKTRPTK